jgi:hypothetical protein
MAIAPSIRIDIRGSGRKPISSTNTLCSLPHHNCNFYQGHTSIIRIESIAKTTHQSTRRARDNQHFKTMNTSTVPTIIYANYANCQPRHLPTMPTMPSANNATANHAIYANCQPRHICQPRHLPTTPSANNANHAISYSQYYGENYFKGGVFTQLCGWQGVVDLWTGAVSGFDYNRRERYLEKQKQFQEKDLVEIHNAQQNRVINEVVPFLKYLRSLSPCNSLINNGLLFPNAIIK